MSMHNKHWENRCFRCHAIQQLCQKNCKHEPKKMYTSTLCNKCLNIYNKRKDYQYFLQLKIGWEFKSREIDMENKILRKIKSENHRTFTIKRFRCEGTYTRADNVVDINTNKKYYFRDYDNVYEVKEN